jgi:hypothetical protein
MKRPWQWYVNDVLERMWKEADVAYFKVLAQHLQAMKENREMPVI